MSENRFGGAAFDHVTATLEFLSAKKNVALKFLKMKMRSALTSVRKKGNAALTFVRTKGYLRVTVNRTLLRRVVPLAVILSGIAAFFYFDLDSYVTFEALQQRHEWLLAQVADHTVLTVLAFMLAYAAIVAFSLPGAAVMSIAGGFLFGQWMGMMWNVVAATTGATALFIVARTAWGDLLHEKAGPWLESFEKGFQENAFNYLLAMRLVPAFPFFVVNLVPAFLGVGLRTFVIATFFGIIPGAFVYSSVGAGLGSLFESGQSFTGRGILTPEIVTAIVGLVVLSLLPVAYRLWMRQR